MKYASVLLLFAIFTSVAFGQRSPDDYGYFSKKADSLYKAGDYLERSANK